LRPLDAAGDAAARRPYHRKTYHYSRVIQFATSVMSQKYPYKVNVALSPHPIPRLGDHPLPIRWGEGRLRGAAVSSLAGVIVKKRQGQH